MKPEDISRLVSASNPRLSPDGRHVAYVVNHIDEQANEYRGRIWVAATDGSTPPRPLTAGEASDQNPCWHPNGSALAFTSSRRKDDKGKTRSSLFLLPFDVPGETVLLAEGDESFGELAFSPDGGWLAYVTRTRGDHYKEDDIGRRPPRRIHRTVFSMNGDGITLDRPKHVYVLATSGSGQPRNLTPGDVAHESPAWFPDSNRLVAIASPPSMTAATDIRLLTADGSATPTTLAPPGFYFGPAVAPDGSSVAVLGFDDPEVPQNAHAGLLDVGPAVSNRPPRWISTDFDRTWFSMAAPQPPQWAGNELLATVEDRGNTHLYAVADGTSPRLIIGGERTVGGWSTATVDGAVTIAFASSTFTSPAEIFVLIDGEERQLTSVTEDFVAATTPHPAERFTAPSGDVEVDVWMVKPADFDATKKYPMLVNVHGGPFTQYGNFFFDEAQLQAEAGFVVVMSNPRGGSGRENSWGQAVLGPKHKVPGSGWGALDYEDVLAVTDAALTHCPNVDPDRVGILGGSYGGYMTSWALTHTDRYAAGCSERSANNLLSLEYGSDYGGTFHIEIGPKFTDDPDEYLRMSPITYVDKLNTPLLIIHSEEDLRCPVEQADQFFIACQMLGKKDVEYYRFPGENHELSRGGSPIHRKQRAEIILEFFARHLGLETATTGS